MAGGESHSEYSDDGGAEDSKIGFDVDGKLKDSENAGAVTEVAKVSQIPTAPTFQTNGVNNSSPATLNLIPGTNVALTSGSNGAVTVAASGIPNSASNPWGS